jgi:enoyl-CoA hydratase/carnithine racemase
MQQINVLLLNNGEPRSVLDEECRQFGIPNIPEYVDAIEAYGEKRLLILSAAGTHFLTDKKLAELKDGAQKEKAKRFKRFLNETIGKRGELKMFKPKMK